MDYLATFLEGVVTFVSPCLLPMLPLYLAYFAGDANAAVGEGLSDADRNKRVLVRLLGFILGVTLLFGSVLPIIISEWLQRDSSIFDVHDMSRPDLYMEIAVENIISFTVAYFECLLIATIFFAVKAARHIPAFDKDFILILGCQIRKDGSLTKLLQSRADRAVEFASMQKEAAGKDVIFVPSGGQGSDEVMPEAQAIRQYLLSIGIPMNASSPRINRSVRMKT